MFAWRIPWRKESVMTKCEVERVRSRNLGVGGREL